MLLATISLLQKRNSFICIIYSTVTALPQAVLAV